MTKTEHSDGRLQWEEVTTDPASANRPYPHEIVTWRAKVPGGWLVTVWGSRPSEDGRTGKAIEGGSNWGGGLTFVPDPAHGWQNPEP